MNGAIVELNSSLVRRNLRRVCPSLKSSIRMDTFRGSMSVLLFS